MATTSETHSRSSRSGEACVCGVGTSPTKYGARPGKDGANDSELDILH